MMKEFEREKVSKVGEELRQEIMEYLGLQDSNDDHNQFLNKQFKIAEKEDANDETAFKHM